MCNAVSVLFLSSYSRFILCYPKNVEKNKSYSGRDKEIWHYVQEENKRRGYYVKGEKEGFGSPGAVGIDGVEAIVDGDVPNTVLRERVVDVQSREC